MQVKYTKKKFYNKWDYKINLYVIGAGYIRVFKESLRSNDFSPYFYSRADIPTIKKFLAELDNFQKENYQMRVEHNYIDIYTNDVTIYNTLTEQFKELITYTSIPTGKDIQSEHGFIPILTNKLPHDRYTFKAFLKPHVLKDNKEAKYGYLNFLNLQKPRIKISNSVENWFVHNNVNWDPRYIYVEDKNTLLMLKMKNSPVLGRVYEYILDDK